MEVNELCEFKRGELHPYKPKIKALNEMLKRVQHDKKKYVIPNHALNQVQGLRFRNLEFEIDNVLIAFVLVMDSLDSNYYSLESCKKFS